MIKIVALGADTFIIQPTRDSSLGYHRTDDLSTELRALKVYLGSLRLFENIDYTVLDDRHNPDSLKFTGKSLVLRSLFTIPQDRFEFWGGRGDNYLLMKNSCAVRIGRKECFVDDVKFVTQADLTLFNFIKLEVNKAHKDFSPRSHLMVQLEQDLAAIEKYEDDIFYNRKCLSALSSVIFAYRSELKQKTAVAPYTFIKGNSILAPKYKTLIEVLLKNINEVGSKVEEDQILPFYHDTVVHRRLQNGSIKSSVNVPPAKPAAAITAPVEPTPSQQFTSTFFSRFKHTLIARRNEVQKRIDNKQWFQDTNKNDLKKNAIDSIIAALNTDKTPGEISSIINENREILTQSTSTLPGFFRNKVSSVSILEDYGRFLELR